MSVYADNEIYKKKHTPKTKQNHVSPRFEFW